MSPWDEEDMVWGLWIDVFKGDHVFILVDYFSGYLTLCYFAKQAVFHRHFSLCFALTPGFRGGGGNGFGCFTLFFG